MAFFRLWAFFAYTALVTAIPAHGRRQGTSLQTTTTSTTYTSSVPTTQTVTNTNAPDQTGSLVTTLPSGAATSTPLPSGKTSTTGLVKVNAATSLSPATVTTAAASSVNVFVPIATASPATSLFPRRGDNPAPVKGITNTAKPVNSNKFYANAFLENQYNGMWTHPYSLTWIKGQQADISSYGMGVSQIDPSQFGYASGSPPEYYISPIGVYSFIFTAAQIGSSTTLTVDSDTAFSANINLKSGTSAITFPVTQGMGFVTAIYQKADVQIQSNVAFLSLTFVRKLAVTPAVYKYRVALQDGKNWLMYVTPSGSTGQPPFVLTNNRLITGPTGFNGIIQVSKNPGGSTEEGIIDKSAGVYPTNTTLSGSTTGGSGTYSLSWTKGGITSRTLLMYALPHHVASFDSTTSSALVNTIQLRATTKGNATALVADKITMVENNLPINYGFLPWQNNNPQTLTSSAYANIEAAAESELSQNLTAQCVLNSMYYSGKALAKFAQIVLVTNDVTKNSSLAAAGLTKLKQVFDVFVQNKQPYPLAYDTKFKGLISTAMFTTGNSLDDFGNGYYNDHHFHYGYFVYTAAVIGYLDPIWLNTGKSKAWVQQLLRDYANPSPSDTAYAHSRSFDWYHGHSWAKGLYASQDGKDQESTSEDLFSSYAMKMWGRTIGDAAIEGRGNLLLAVQSRSFQNYFLMDSSNTNQPAQFIPNKVTGILFENKVDHTTYFGSNIEYIEGIHMIPLNPLSPYCRTQKFVTEEWNTYFSNGRVDSVAGGWRGILYANLAIIDPTTSYNWFSGPNFDPQYLDGGASLTWYLTFAAGLGGALA